MACNCLEIQFLVSLHLGLPCEGAQNLLQSAPSSWSARCDMLDPGLLMSLTAVLQGSWLLHERLARQGLPAVLAELTF